MPEELLPRYDHKAVEEKIYELWEKSGYFNPDNLPAAKNAEPFTIIMPPTNANGSLHIGHAVGFTLQDILTRFWRMRGRRALWLPGADHAGFETQVVYDKKLEKEGRNRFAMGREEIWEEVWEFTQKNKEIMYAQTKKLGASCDWSREKFTLDPNIVREVEKTFVKLYEDGLAYRDLRVVNWCPKHKTALSDLEVKYIEREDPLYYIKYGPLTLATVRPETKFGDTALAVNPKDKRYKKYIGKEIEAKGVLGPLKFKVIADKAVDAKFGTGVVKVTPAHDSVDFEIWTRHKDEIPGPKIVIDENGRLAGEVGEFKGLKVMEARAKVAEAMERLGILEKVDPKYLHQVATCYKCGSTLEPRPLPQWFVKMAPLVKPAIEAVQKGKIKFYPDRIKKVYFHWLKNIRDWNISRQIVWGIRIPAWFCIGCGEVKVNAEIKSRWFLVRHGETDWNKEGRLQGQTDIPLNSEGRAQAKKTAETLKNSKIDLIISSPLSRAKETAEIIAKEIGAEIIYEPEFRERSYGVGDGLFHEEIHKRYGGYRHYEKTIIEGAETYKEVEMRAKKALAHHKGKHHHKNVLIVAHGGLIRALQKHVRNLSVDEMFDLPVMKNGEVISFDLGDPCKKCGGDMYEQDPDVFDTWFSSGQWPYLALGFQESSDSSKSKIKNQKLKIGNDFETFYPTDVMETAYDILFFWVARMVMFGLYRTGKIPFKNVYIHGLVRDKDRQKMSKSKGNVVDPLGIAETYGTDAVRMALVVGNTAGNDIIISEDKIRGYRNFVTKIWNVARFVLANKPATRYSLLATRKGRANIKELENLKTEVTAHIESFEFHLAAEKLYHYIWHELADKIVEAEKKNLREGNAAQKSASYALLEHLLLESLKMLHPFMPFITEEIYQKLHPEKILMVEKW